MRITVRVHNGDGRNDVSLDTEGRQSALLIPAKATGLGSSVNGGELLFLALATCYCNDIYREAAKRGIRVEQVEVEVEGEFGGEGEPARAVTYRARLTGNASQDELRELARITDGVAEIHNTLRGSTPVVLSQVEVRSTAPA